jgi:hypothetical protein
MGSGGGLAPRVDGDASKHWRATDGARWRLRGAGARG